MSAIEPDSPLTASAGAFRNWRAALEKKSLTERRVEEWLFLNAAGVLLADKTGELLTLRHDEFVIEPNDLRSTFRNFSDSWCSDIEIMQTSNGSTKLLLYRPDLLQKVLDEAPFCVIHERLNYILPLSARSFVRELKTRWESRGHLPHEIGIALGYPLDDVFGYMGLLPLPCKGVCGWRVFGCMAESRRRSCSFSDARCQALQLLALGRLA